MEKRCSGDEDFREISTKVGMSFTKCAYTFRKTMIKFLKAYMTAGLLPKMTKGQLYELAKQDYAQNFIHDLVEQIVLQERAKATPSDVAPENE